MRKKIHSGWNLWYNDCAKRNLKRLHRFALLRRVIPASHGLRSKCRVRAAFFSAHVV